MGIETIVHMSCKFKVAPLVATTTTRSFSTSKLRPADFTHAVIGAGAVGLAIARRLAARPGTSTVLIERHGIVGTETSSRNSEVIHAGLYYGPSSLKTRLCRRGKEMMYDLCSKQNIPYRRTGKWIIAQQDQQMAELEDLHAFAYSIGVPTRFLSRKEMTEREPDVRAEAGVLESESTGIVDTHGLMSYLEADFVDKGGDCAFHTAVRGVEAIDQGKRGYRISTIGPSSSSSSPSSSTSSTTSSSIEDTIEAETVINSAGLSACAINNMLLPAHRRQTPHYAKGTYYSYSSPHPKPKTLLYPAPIPGSGGLGTHLTLDLSGRIRFGPDLEWIDDPTTTATTTATDSLDLTPSSQGLAAAIAVIRSYLPTIRPEALAPDYCGIRPKISRSAATAGHGTFQDFIVREEAGFPGFVNLLAIESPGLTSCLAIGELVEGILYGGGDGDG